MKRKIVNYFLVAALALGATTAVSSCKDTDEDLRIKQEEQFNKEIQSLKAKYDADIEALRTSQQQLQAAVDALKVQCDGCFDRCKAAWEAAIAQATANMATKTDVENAQAALQAEIDKCLKAADFDNLMRDYIANSTYFQALTAQLANIESTLTQLTAADAAMASDIANINSQLTVINNNITNIGADVAALATRVTAAETALSQLQSSLTELNTKFGNLELTVQGMQTDISTLMGFMNQWSSVLPQMQADITAAQGTANQAILDAAAAMAAAQANASEITALKTALQSLQSQLDGITSCQCPDWSSEINAIKGDITVLNTTIGTLQTDVAAAQAAADAAMAAATANLETAKTYADTQIAAAIQALLTNEIASIINDIANLTTTTGNNTTEITNLWTSLSSLTSIVNANSTNIANNTSDIAANTAAINQTNVDLAGVKTDVSALSSALTDLTSTVSAISSTVSGLETTVSNLSSSITSVENQANANAANISALQSTVSGIQTDLSNLETRVAQNEQDIVSLKSDVAANTADIAQNTADIQTLTGNLRELSDYVNHLITGVLVQGTYNDVFGMFALPVGVRSNMLLTYWGQADHNINFPSYMTSDSYNNENLLTEGDYTALANQGMRAVRIEDGTVLLPDNAGVLYLTINPTNVDFTGANFQLVNSRDEALGVQIKDLQASDDLLTFGWSRGNNNGFYRATAYVTGDNIDEQLKSIGSVQIEIENGMKTALKDVVKNRDRSSIVNLAKKLYDQFNGFMPALGVKASWTLENGQTESVYSKYEVGAAAFRPLSYRFLYDTSLRHFPTLPDLGSLLDFSIDVPSISIQVPPFVIDFDNLPFNIDFAIEIEVQTDDLKIVVNEFPIGVEIGADGKPTGTLITEPRTFYVDNLDDLLQSIADQIAQQSAQLDTTVRAAFDAAMDELQRRFEVSINNFVNNIENNIEDSLADVINDLTGKLNDKISSLTSGRFANYYERLQNLINRVNARIDNANHYLQPLMIYNNGSNYGRMSNSKALPSQFVFNGGNAITLFPTSYTAEIAAPSYKKFVAVSNVYGPNGEVAHTADGSNGDATCLEMMKKANEQPYMNEVVSGGRLNMPLYLMNKPGYIYEIVYSAVDYHGITSTMKYYLQIR